MAKKTFKNNPALQFISTPEEEPAEEVTTTKDTSKKRKLQRVIKSIQSL